MRWRIDFRDHRAHLFLMQQSGKRLTILVTNEEVIAIDDFRFKNRMRNRSDAVRALLKLGLKKVGRSVNDPDGQGNKQDGALHKPVL